MKNIYLIFLSIILFSCSTYSVNLKDDTLVFKSAVNNICGSGVGEGYLDSELSLLEEGIDVINSSCSYVENEDGSLDCKHFERINIHQIRSSNKKDVVRLGYLSIGELESVYGLSLSKTECMWQ